MSPATPGWYPDQNDPSTERLWDGSRWTDERRPVTTTSMAAPAQAFTGPAWYRRTWIVALATFIVGVGVGAAAMSGGSDDKTSSKPSPAAANDPTPTDEEPADVETPTPEPALPTPKPGDFKVRVKIREKQCFGSAGCSITYQIVPSYIGSDDLSTGSWDITYKVTGAEDPIINTMTLEDGTFSFDEEEDADTSSSSKQLYAKVTEVSARNVE